MRREVAAAREREREESVFAFSLFFIFFRPPLRILSPSFSFSSSLSLHSLSPLRAKRHNEKKKLSLAPCVLSLKTLHEKIKQNKANEKEKNERRKTIHFYP